MRGARVGGVVPKRGMARRPREEEKGALHHVWARGNRQEALFVDERDRRLYLRLLGHAVIRYEWLCLSYLLMDNHIHLLVETPQPNLGRGMQWMHGHYGRHLSRRVDRPGHAFQGRFGSKRIKDEGQLWTVVQYIARNPVKAGLCETPREWEWSSHAGVVDATAPAWIARPRLLEYFEGLGGEPAARYAALVG
jgi:putative transposase